MNYIAIDHYIDFLMTSKPDMPLWNIESIRQGKKPTWNYIDGCMTTSLLEMYKTTGEKKYLDFVLNFVDYYVFDDGSIRGYNPKNYSTDDVCESRILFDLYHYTKNEKYLKAIKLSYTQIEGHPRTKEGNFFHKAMYHDQVWLDGLYMIQPFYTRYQCEFGGADYSDIVKQFQNVKRIMFNSKDELYYHGYDESRTLFWADKKTGLSKNYWLRSIGWYLTGLIDVYSFMENAKPEQKQAIAEIFVASIKGILKYKDPESNMFYQVPNFPGREGNYLETSGSSMIAYAVLKGARLGLLAKEYQKIGQDIFEGIAKKYMTIGEDGSLNLKGICLVAGLGPETNLRRDGSYEYYISEPVVENDAKGVGPFIMAYTEIKKLQK